LQFAVNALLLSIAEGILNWRAPLAIPSFVDLSRGLSPEEVNGSLPVFVDAFLDTHKDWATIILNTKHLRNLDDAYEKLAGASWRCKWWGARGSDLHEPPDSLTSFAHLVVPGDSPIADAHRKTLVVHCQVPKWPHQLVAGLEALDETGSRIFERKGIKVRQQSVFAPSETALCTMVIKDSAASPFLADWVRYHQFFGFDQIVVYVEDQEHYWAQEMLRPLMAA